MTLATKDPKPKTCAHCQEKFTPRRGSIGQKACSPSCALALAPLNQGKAIKSLAQVERQKHKEAKQRVKRKSEFASDAQKAVNAWVRERDRGLPCISCGVNYPSSETNMWDAGHLRSVGANSATRFNTYNINKQCVRCNRYLSSNALQYRIGLVEKIGERRVSEIYANSQKTRFSVDYLIRIRDVFRKRLRILKKIRASKVGFHEESIAG